MSYTPVANHANSLRKWRAAYDKSRSGAAAKVWCWGDSITELSPSGNTWADQLRARIRAANGEANNGVGAVLLTSSVYGSGTEPTIALAGTWTPNNNGRSGLLNSTFSSSTSGSTITYTPAGSVDGFTISYIASNFMGTFTYSIDGGAAVNVVANNGGATTVAVVNIPTTLGAHSIVITSPAANGLVCITAIEATVGTSGVRVSKIGKSGAQPSDPPINGEAYSTWFTNTAPDLTVILAGANEYNNQIALATYSANMTSLVTAAKATGSVLVCTGLPNNYPGAHPIPMTSYNQTAVNVALAQEVAVLDLYARWKGYTVSQPLGLYNDTVTHPNAAGAADIANAVLAVIRDGLF